MSSAPIELEPPPAGAHPAHPSSIARLALNEDGTIKLFSLPAFNALENMQYGGRIARNGRFARFVRELAPVLSQFK
eukprot:6482649-Amphidinium_carterae.1